MPDYNISQTGGKGFAEANLRLKIYAKVETQSESPGDVKTFVCEFVQIIFMFMWLPHDSYT